MIRSGLKNHKDVSVLVDPIQYQAFLAEIKKGVLDEAYKAKLALELFNIRLTMRPLYLIGYVKRKVYKLPNTLNLIH